MKFLCYLIFAVSFLLKLVLVPGISGASGYARERPLTGDETHYALMAESIWVDQDIELANNQQEWKEGKGRIFWAGLSNPDIFPIDCSPASPKGKCYDMHQPGFSFLIAPFLYLFGMAGVTLFINLISSLIPVLLFLFAIRFGLVKKMAFMLALLFSTTQPLFVYSFQWFPEIFGGVAVLFGAYYLMFLRGKTWLDALFGAVLFLLPWLHIKFLPFSILLFAIWLFFVIREKAFKWHSLFPALGLIGGLLSQSYFHFLEFGIFSPLGGQSESATGLSLNIWKGLVGYFASADFGVWFYAPFYLAAIGGLVQVFRRSKRLFWIILLLFGTGYLISASHVSMGGDWFGGWSPGPARYLVPVLPLLLLPCIFIYKQLKGKPLVFYKVLILFSLGWTMFTLLGPKFLYNYVNNAVGYSFVFDHLGIKANEFLPFVEKKSLQNLWIFILWGILFVAIITLFIKSASKNRNKDPILYSEDGIRLCEG